MDGLFVPGQDRAAWLEMTEELQTELPCATSVSV